MFSAIWGMVNLRQRSTKFNTHFPFTYINLEQARHSNTNHICTKFHGLRGSLKTAFGFRAFFKSGKMSTFKIPLKNKDYNLTTDCKPGAFQKLAKSFSFSFRETFPVRIDKGPNYSVDPVTDIGALFIPIVKYLRIIGFCPFNLRQDPATGFVVYEFKWKSWLTVYSICLSTLFGLFACFIFSLITWTSFSHDFIEVL